MKFLKNLVLLTLPSVAVTFVLLEIFFRLFIPVAELPYLYFDPEYQVLRFDTQEVNTGVYTVSKWGHQPARWRINNAGWNSNIDYRLSHETAAEAVLQALKTAVG